MNHTQRKHAKQRLSEIYHQKLNEQHKKMTEEVIKNRLKALQKGNFKINKDCKSHSLDYMITFTKKAGNTEWASRYNMRTKKDCKLEQAYQRAMDEIMLGDNEEVLKILEDFRNLS